MAIYKKALIFLLSLSIMTLAACNGEYEISVVDDNQPESSASSSTPADTDMEDNSNMENSNQYGGNWPDNEFTKQVPDPGFDVHSVTTNSNSCNITFSNTTIDQLKGYVETIKASGFTTVLTRETETRGMIHYLYSARNANGYEIVVTKSISYSILAINKLD